MNMRTRALLAISAGALTLGAVAAPASAGQRSGTVDGAHWYIGSGNAYGEVEWDDRNSSGDSDRLYLHDDLIPAGYSVKMTVEQGSFKDTVYASNGGSDNIRIPGFSKGEKAKFKACARDNGETVTCRPWTTVTE
ncbi:hypothetical protein GCM10027091_14390 [Streptomyces daliensis]